MNPQGNKKQTNDNDPVPSPGPSADDCAACRTFDGGACNGGCLLRETGDPPYKCDVTGAYTGSDGSQCVSDNGIWCENCPGSNITTQSPEYARAVAANVCPTGYVKPSSAEECKPACAALNPNVNASANPDPHVQTDNDANYPGGCYLITSDDDTCYFLSLIHI